MGIHGFLDASNFIDGGVMGISMLVAKSTKLPLSLLILLTNFPFLIIAYRIMGKAFAVRSVIAIIGLSLVLALVHFPAITSDKILIAIFGGFFIGTGIGLTIRGSAVLDGTEIAALLISKKSTLFRVGDIILIFNISLFLSAIYLLGVESALYSILTYMSAAKTLDFVIHGLEEYTAVTIISGKATTVREEIISQLGRGVTIFKGTGGLSGRDQEILYCVVTKLEIGSLKKLVREIDKDSFVTFHSLLDAEGGVIKKKALH